MVGLPACLGISSDEDATKLQGHIYVTNLVLKSEYIIKLPKMERLDQRRVRDGFTCALEINEA
ncbi:hypothetical protein Pyn_00532 [Prunus yedoensis var. nudiflora]|uniref:Uncharacterized protein n=1 Tax=Prunus yedoensis var. nudiflora TaxID=2094558 RepID=A0A314UKB9_PRUYE|nr:hypothetical protein Pyn_00532 [Prunus yedoensis var. nudiflora]